jgi:DNA primase
LISQTTIQQILQRTDIIEIVGGFVKLKKRGANYLGLCPFHNEKTPSFTVSPSKEIYKCFGCGKSGNTISFLMEHEKYSYVESLRWLANKYNVEIAETEMGPEQKQEQQTAESLFAINNFAQKYFSNNLLQSEEGTDMALSYLTERGFGKEVIEKFQLGYSLNTWDAFSSAAKTAQFNPELLLKSGLVIAREERLLDNYRGRIIFPVHNQTGKVIGFGARIIGKNDKAPKYINTPENEIYIKSKIVYGSYFARQAIDKKDECLLVEGYTDVVSLHQAGIENVVASGGTSLTVDQLRLIRKYTNNLTIIYDGDPAGVKAALRGLDMAIEEGLNVKLVLIPDNEDPDSYVNKIGPTKFQEFIEKNKKDFILFRVEVALKDAGDDTNKKAEVVNQIAETIAKINKAEDFTRQQDYIRQCASIMKIEESGLMSLVNKYIREKITKQESRQLRDEPQVWEEAIGEQINQRTDFSDDTYNVLFQDRLQEEAITRSLLEFGQMEWEGDKKIADHIFDENIDDDLFEDQALIRIIETYKDYHFHGKHPSVTDFVNSQDQAVSQRVIAITNFPYEESKHWVEQYDAGGINKKIFNMSWDDFNSKVVKYEGINPAILENDEENLYKRIVEDNLIYLQLRKIKKLLLMNQQDMKNAHTDAEMLNLIQTHNFLKQKQRELGDKKGIVSYPF